MTKRKVAKAQANRRKNYIAGVTGRVGGSDKKKQVGEEKKTA